MQDDKIIIPVLLGTTREGRVSENVARLVAEMGNTYENVETRLVDPREFNFPEDGKEPPDPEFQKITASAHAFFIVSPEYNHSYPPSLKRMLESETDFSHYRKKPVAIAGVSDGQWGGTRMIEALLPVLRAMDFYVISRDAHFPYADKLFDGSGRLLDEKYKTDVDKVYKDLIWKARVLKWGRENMPLL